MKPQQYVLLLLIDRWVSGRRGRGLVKKGRPAADEGHRARRRPPGVPTEEPIATVGHEYHWQY